MSTRVLTFPASSAPVVDRRDPSRRATRVPHSQLRAIRIAEQVEREIAARKSLRAVARPGVSVGEAWNALWDAIGRKLSAMVAGITAR